MREASAALEEARALVHSFEDDNPGRENHSGAWWQIEEAWRDLGNLSRGERNTRSTPRYVALPTGALRIPDGPLYDLLEPLPNGFDHRLRRALVLLIRTDRILAPMAQTQAITDARLRIGAAYALVVAQSRNNLAAETG
jgi:hypothetical protein